MLRVGVAALWALTGLLVVHPAYRAVGGGYLDQLGLPHLLMWGTCAFEVALAAAVALLPARPAITALQVAMVSAFTVILAVHEPVLLASPVGVLTKNLPFLACVLTAFFLEREGWSARAVWTLRLGLAAIWLTEGLVPKLLFLQAWELDVVARSGASFGRPDVLLRVLGVAQVVSAFLALALKGTPLRWVLFAQLVALVVLPLWVGYLDPSLLVHPFGPLTKNLPIVAGTYVLYRQCSTWS